MRPGRSGSSRLAVCVLAGFGLAVLECRRQREVLRTRIEQLEGLSRTDDLTQTYNRRHVEDHLGLAVTAARRHKQALSVLFIDIDGFKRVNDELGHQAGDAVLKLVARRIQSALRNEDVVGRWGGEEFLAVLPMTPLSGALVLAERLRSTIAATPVQVDRHAVSVTVSIGCAETRDDGVSELLRTADAALYRAKEGGRNRVGALED